MHGSSPGVINDYRDRMLRSVDLDGPEEDEESA